jgi:hypothetical protein
VAQLAIAASWCVVLRNKGIRDTWERAGTRRGLYASNEGRRGARPGQEW